MSGQTNRRPLHNARKPRPARARHHRRSRSGNTRAAAHAIVVRETTFPVADGLPGLERTPRSLIQAATPVFIGMGIGLGLAGMIARLGSMGTTHGATTPGSLVVASALVAIAFGIRISQHLTDCCAARLDSGNRAFDWKLLWMGRNGGTDPALLAKRFAVVTLLGGAAAALLPLQANLAQALYRLAHVLFVWSDIALIPLQFVVVCLALFVPFWLLGMAISLAHAQGGATGRWNNSVTAALLGGVAVGLLLSGLVPSKPDLMLVGSSLPVLFSSLLIAISIADERGAFTPSDQDDHVTLPTECDDQPRVLRSGMLMCTAAMVVVGFGALQSAEWTHPVAIGCVALGTLLAWHGVGRGREAREVAHWLVVCGVAALFLALCARFVPAAGSGLTQVVIMVTLVLLGQAVADGHEALARRVPGHSPVHGTMLARELLTCAVFAAVLLSMARFWMDWPQMLVLVGIALGCAGGVLIARERLVFRRRRDGILLLTGAGAGAAVLAIACF